DGDTGTPPDGNPEPDGGDPPLGMVGIPCAGDVCMPGPTTAEGEVCCMRGAINIFFQCETQASCNDGGIRWECDSHEDCREPGRYCFARGGTLCLRPQDAGNPDDGIYVYQPVCHDLESSRDCNTSTLPSPGLPRCCRTRTNEGIVINRCEDENCTG